MASNQQGSGSHRGGSGNFADDPKRASEAGKKGGEHSRDSSQASGHQPSSTQQGSGKHSGDDRAKASETDKKGGSR